MLGAGDTLGHEGGASPMGLVLLRKGLGALASPPPTGCNEQKEPDC